MSCYLCASVYFVDGAIKSVVYRSNGNPITSTPDVSFEYDPLYRRLSAFTDGTGTTTVNYNPITGSLSLGAGLTSGILGPNGAYNIVYGYDELGRLISRSIDGVAESLEYDGFGRLCRHNTALGTFTWFYPDGPSSWPASDMAYPNGQEVRFAYQSTGEHLLSDLYHLNGLGQISKFTYAYDALRRVNQWSQQVETSTPEDWSLQYDRANQLLDVLVKGNGVATKGYAYQYDLAGNRTSEEIDSGASSVITTSGFNPLNQLMTKSGSGLLPVRFAGTVNERADVTVGGQAAEESYDANTGEEEFRSTLGLEPGTHSVNVFARDYGAGTGNTSSHDYSVLVVGGAAKQFGYDDNGNCNWVTGGGAGAVYDWDAADRLVKITIGGAVTEAVTEFTYDAFGRRVAEKLNGAVIKRFVWSGAELCQERDANNAVTKKFFAEGEQIGVASYYFTRDHLGSVREMTDSTGTVRARYSYDPFGRRTRIFGDLDADFGFTGHYFHASSGLHLALYRAYDADSGRWLNRDPIAEQGGMNLYGYVGNSPVSLFDADGLWFKETFRDIGHWIYDDVLMGNRSGSYNSEGYLAQRTAMLHRRA